MFRSAAVKVRGVGIANGGPTEVRNMGEGVATT